MAGFDLFPTGWFYPTADSKKARVAPGRGVFYSRLERVDPPVLADVLNEWLQAQHGQLPAALALDGKAVTDRLAQVVSLVSQQTGATVAVAPVLTTKKEHEVPAARALLEKTPLDDTLVSLDAGHANHDTARTIVQSGGDYLIQLKDNCPVVRAQAAHAVQDQAPLFLRRLTPQQLGFPHAATVLAVRSETLDKKTGQSGGELRLFVSSLERTALTPRQWLAHARGHWKVESGNHYLRDVTWREDEERGCKARRACNLALLRSALLGALLRDAPCNLSALTQHYALRFLLSPHAQP